MPTLSQLNIEEGFYMFSQKNCSFIVLILSLFLIAPVSYSFVDTQKETDFSLETSLIVTDETLLIHTDTGFEVFTENRGQWNSEISFISPTPFGQIGLSQDCIFINLREFNMNPNEDLDLENNIEVNGYVFKYIFEDANDVIPIGIEPQTYKTNFFYGNESSLWITDVNNYQFAYYENLWNNIDLKYSNEALGPKYELILHPGANPEDIRIQVEGLESLSIENDDLVFNLENGQSILDKNLQVFYRDHTQEIIESSFKIIGDKTFTFDLGHYDTTREVIIDPLVYSTYIGGSGWDQAKRIDYDSGGNAYVVGHTFSADFPNTTGAYDRSPNGNVDVSVFKLNPSGSGLVYSTFIGGNAHDYASDIAVDSNGNAFITGATRSKNFPNSTNPYDSTHAGEYDAFVVKLNPAGSALVFSTYMGHSGYDMGRGISIDSSGYVYIAGNTSSSSYPTTSGAYDQTYGGVSDVFVTKLNITGDKLIYSTFVGGSSGDKAYDIAIDSSGNAYFTGYTDVFGVNSYPTTPGAYDTSGNSLEDVIVSKLNVSGDKLLLSALVAGSSMERGYCIDLDTNGYVYVAGWTRSTGFPTTGGVFQPTFKGTTSYSEGFIFKLNLTFDILKYSTFLGDTHNDQVNDIDVDSNGIATVVGSTGSTNFPFTPDAENSSHNGGILDAFLTKMNASGTGLLYSTFRGGSGADYGYGVAVSDNGDIYVAGVTSSSDFPTTVSAFSRKHKGTDDCMAFKFSLTTPISPPQNLDGQLGNGYVELTWEEPLDMISSKLTGYNLYRGTTSGAETFLVAPGNVTSYNDTSVTFGQIYYYYVTSLNATSESYPSNEFMAADLIKPRLVADNTPAIATTGDSFIFILDVTDNLETNNTWVEYWFGTGAHNNVSMNYISNNIWDHSIIIPYTSNEQLHYIFYFDDKYHNWNKTSVRDIPVIDNDIPIFMKSGDNPMFDIEYPLTTGDNSSFGVHVVDNIEIDGVWIEYWYGEGIGTHNNLSMVYAYDDWWEITITIQHTIEVLHCIFHANDTSNNWNSTWQLDLIIIDNDKPEFVNLSVWETPPFATTGDKYTLTVSVVENIEVRSVWIEYWYGNGEHINSSMVEGIDLEWYADIQAMDTLKKLNFIFHANDTSENLNTSRQFTTNVLDNDPPEFANDSSTSTATTGDRYTFSIDAWDNIEIASVNLEFFYGIAQPMIISLPSITQTYQYSITIPSDATASLSYYFSSYDTSANLNSTTLRTITILDNDPPEYLGDTMAASANTGSQFDISTLAIDNIAIDEVKAEYWFGEGAQDEIDLDYSEGEFIKTIDIPSHSLEILHIKFSATDTSANVNISKIYNITIIDSIPPTIEPIFDVTIAKGKTINITVNAVDNIGVSDITWSGGPFSPDPTSEILEGVVDESGDYTITVTVTDEAGNFASISFNLTVEDETDKDEKEPAGYIGIIIIVVVIIVIVLILFFLLMKKRKSTEAEGTKLPVIDAPQPPTQQPMQEQVMMPQEQQQIQQPPQPSQQQMVPEPTMPYEQTTQAQPPQDHYQVYEQPPPEPAQDSTLAPIPEYPQDTAVQPSEPSTVFIEGTYEQLQPQQPQSQEYKAVQGPPSEQPRMQPEQQLPELQEEYLPERVEQATTELMPEQVQEEFIEPNKEKYPVSAEGTVQVPNNCPHCSSPVQIGINVCPSCGMQLVF
jgi:hypothetical protein